MAGAAVGALRGRGAFHPAEDHSARAGLQHARDDNGDGLTDLLLPRLPENFQYTDLFVSADSLIIPWEQNAFTEVGAAGLYISRSEPRTQ